MKANVYFTPALTPDAVIRAFEALGVSLPGRVLVKLHSGEAGNQNFLRPAFLAPMIAHVNGTIGECNTAYEGSRNTTAAHRETMRRHGWSAIAPVDILDEEDEWTLPVQGLRLQQNTVGGHLRNYDSILVLSHFKGHPMGGFGGALKNISIGLASSYGKRYIHGAGDPDDPWGSAQDAFLESMADAACSVARQFRGRMAYVNIMCNMSVDCDCCAVAEDPKIRDIGILASLDPVALDQACVDLVYAAEDDGKADLIARMESRHGVHILESAAALGVGVREYTLHRLD